MSVVIKSNNVAKNHFGTSKMLGTTPEIEFQKYKNRVIADGGVIKDEARTLKAFELLFNAKCYGNTNTFVSGEFGVKLEGVNKISKLYSIDGEDQIGVKFGNGSLPLLTNSNAISFELNQAGAGTNGGMFTTAQKIRVSKIGNFALGAKLVENRDRSTSRDLAGLTLHDDAVNTTNICQIIISNSNQIHLQIQKNPLSLTTTNAAQHSVLDTQLPTERGILYLSSGFKRTGFRSGLLATITDGETFSEISSELFYLDFGAMHRSNAKTFNNSIVRHFFCFNQLTEDQAKMLSAF